MLQIDGQDPKMVVYNLQKELNDNEYQSNQRIVKLKKQQEEDRRQLEREQAKLQQNKMQILEEHNQLQYDLEDKKNQLSRQLENLLAQIFQDQNEKDNITD